VKHILVVGPSGSGKTAFIKLVTGLDIEPGHTTDTGTTLLVNQGTLTDESQFYRYQGPS
jgi:ABC-type lipoprotein export system ATPase subunit